MGVDLRTRYLGLELRNPLVPSASPLGASLDTLRRLEDAGAGAVVLPSLFEEQVTHESLEVHEVLETGGFAEAASFFPELDDYNTGPGAYLDHVAAAKEALGIPVIASLNGTSTGGWLRFARLLEEAGADAVELNVYLVAADAETTSAEVESRYLNLVGAVRETLSVPLAVKVAPYFSSMAHMARLLVDAGAEGLVLFNRFVQPDIDLATLRITTEMHLSSAWELRLRLRWIAILRGRVDASLAATGGVHEAEDVVKLLLAGADVTMLASALLRLGPQHLAAVLSGLEEWLDAHGYASVEQLKGSMSQQACRDPEQYERVQYMRALTGYRWP